MWIVPPPPYGARETFQICVTGVRDAALRRKLIGIAGYVAAAASDYETKARARDLHLVRRSNTVGGNVSKAEMIEVYDQRMAAKRAPGRSIYDHIKLLPLGDRCPFCDQRNVSTLDHILPKAHYPALAVTPLNLVGACMECNKARSADVPTSADSVVLHPYFDDITVDQWLVAKVLSSTPCAFQFSVTPPASWDTLTEARARQQFTRLGLAALYASEAARELANIRHNLKTHHESGGSAAVQQELNRQRESRRLNRLNSWQTAMYQAMASDLWFCGGGFL